nr:MAG TPA: hypothetical protein [Caudoviricetes sp.]
MKILDLFALKMALIMAIIALFCIWCPVVDFDLSSYALGFSFALSLFSFILTMVDDKMAVLWGLQDDEEIIQVTIAKKH